MLKLSVTSRPSLTVLKDFEVRQNCNVITRVRLFKNTAVLGFVLSRLVVLEIRS